MLLAELIIVSGALVDEPPVTGGILINSDSVIDSRGDCPARQIHNLDLHISKRIELLFIEAE
jgi:hypothetical protein